MIKLILILTLAFNFSFANARENNDLSLSLAPVDWQFETVQFPGLNYVYTPFFVSEKNQLTLFTSGAGVNPGNGVRILATNTTGSIPISEKIILASGPDRNNYNYFRAQRIAKSGQELWMITEIAGCYAGCESTSAPKKLASYYSSDNGLSWKFVGFVNVNKKPYVALWNAHTGLVWNPAGSTELDLVNYANNRFITTGESRDILISNDGVNFVSIPMNHPFPHDRLIFTSLAKTPYGFHMMTSANWSDKYYTTTVRHLFSKNLIDWYPIESNSFLKNPNFYKGVHLSYDETNDKLWAISPCGSQKACSFVAWTKPKDYLGERDRAENEILPVGEFVDFAGKTVMILGHVKSANQIKYKVRYYDGTLDSGYTKEMFTFPLKNYSRQGCLFLKNETLCVGDAIYIGNSVASIMGIYNKDSSKIKFAIKYPNGQVFNGFTREMFTLTW